MTADPGPLTQPILALPSTLVFATGRAAGGEHGTVRMEDLCLRGRGVGHFASPAVLRSGEIRNAESEQ